MCGIAGWFTTKTNNTQQLPELQRMVDAIAHRGPDGRGTQILDHAALGHARLSIIDLAGGHQPMFSHDNRYCIIFNGEIYNYYDLKKRLASKGHRFKTQSDTEIIIELFRAYGWQGFSHLRGMFAFALWDSQDNSGVLVRDPLGIKPLFISKDQNGLGFASEAKGLLARHNERAQLNSAGLHLLMNFRYLPGEHTLFQGISQLPAGQIIEWRQDGTTISRQIVPETPTSDSILGALRHSVQAHLTADVEVGAYLSGGIDSATIAAIGKELSPQPLRTFTLKAGDDSNEALYAARSSELLDQPNIQSGIDCDIGKQLPRLVWHLETPKVNALQVSLLAQMTSRHVKVALSGLGGDELFYGYNAHRILHQACQAYRWFPASISHGLGGVSSNLAAFLQKPLWTESERAFRMLHNLGNWPRVYGLLRNVWDSSKLRNAIYGPRLLDQALPDAFVEIESRWPRHHDPVTAMAQFEFSNKMVNDLLWQEDRVSMAEGLEVRTPFVDSWFARNVQQLTRATLMPHNCPKGYMRAMLKDVLPREILDRPKSGFQVSSPDFFHQHLKPLAFQYLNPGRIKEYGLFNPVFVDLILKQRPHTGLRWHYFILYLMLLTHIWIELFEHGRTYTDLASTD